MALIVVGLIAGILAKIAMPGPDPGGFIGTILIGIAGSFVGGYIVKFFTGNPVAGGLSLGSILTATVGAILLLVIYRFITRRVA